MGIRLPPEADNGRHVDVAQAMPPEADMCIWSAAGGRQQLPKADICIASRHCRRRRGREDHVGSHATICRHKDLPEADVDVADMLPQADLIRSAHATQNAHGYSPATSDRLVPLRGPASTAPSTT